MNASLTKTHPRLTTTDTDTDDEITIVMDDKKLALLQWAIGLIGAVALSAVPWAFVVQSDLATIKARLESVPDPPAWVTDQVKENAAAIRDLNHRVTKNESKIAP